MKLLPQYFICHECGNYECTRGDTPKSVSVRQNGKPCWESVEYALNDTLPCGLKSREFYKEIEANRNYKGHSYLKDSYERGYADGFRDGREQG